MKLYKTYGRANKAGCPISVIFEGERRWALSPPRPKDLTDVKKARFDMMLGGKVTVTHPRTFTVGKLDEDHYCLIINGVAGGSLTPELFSTKGKAMSAFRKSVMSYANDPRWQIRA